MMKSQIDWNEIVPRLAEGLQQTLYLEAVRIITGMTANGSAEHLTDHQLKRREYNRRWYAKNRAHARRAANRRYAAKRDYAAEYKRRLDTGSRKLVGGKRRKFTADMKREVLDYHKTHSWKETTDKYRISGSMLTRWKSGKLTPTEEAAK